MNCLVLIEGMDYSGKSTTTQNVATYLRDQSFNVYVNTGNLHKNWWDRFCTFLYQSDKVNDRLLALFFSVSPLIDKFFYKTPNNTIVLQETYADRAIAYNWAHNYRLLYWWMSLSSKYYVQFDINFYLHADIDIRKQRFLSRLETNKNDNILIDNTDKFVRTEKKLSEIISKSDSIIFVDTGIHSPIEVTQIVSQHIAEYMEGRNANII